MDSIIASFNQMQVEIQNEKIKDGISNAKSNGKKLGRKRISDDKVKMIKALKNEGYTNSEIAIQLNISENITPHKWRHTFATTFIKNGGDLEILRLLLGHSNLKTTQKYLHLSRNDIVDNYQKIMN